MPASTRFAAKSIAKAISYSLRQVPTTIPASAELNALPQRLSEYRAAIRVRDLSRTEPLSLRTAILCIGALSVIGWAVILLLFLVLV